MLVQKINDFSSNSYSPNFYGVYRDVYIGGNIKHRNVSWMFRPSLNESKNFYRYISDAFKHVKKVNVYSYACSLGYEVYSFILGMLSGPERNPEKFFPVIAKDYDETIINCANTHIIPLENFEIGLIEEILGDKNKITDFLYLFENNPDYRAYFEKLNAKGNTLGIPNENIANNIKFSAADIRTDYQNIEPENSIVLAANFWPYMSETDRYTLAMNLYDTMEDNCYVKIDTFDNGIYPGGTFIPTSELLLDNGFKLTPILNLFKKG